MWQLNASNTHNAKRKQNCSSVLATVVVAVFAVAVVVAVTAAVVAVACWARNNFWRSVSRLSSANKMPLFSDSVGGSRCRAPSPSAPPLCHSTQSPWRVRK